MNEVKIPSGTWYKTLEEAQVELDTWAQISKEIERQGFIFVKILEGQKKGSIAKYYFDYTIYVVIKEAHSSYFVENKNSSCGILKWDKRKNTEKTYFNSSYLTWLKDYSGETLWNVVDAEEAKLEALDKPQVDLNGDILNINDSVYYMNLRYGNSPELCRGSIKEFTAQYCKSRDKVTVFAIVLNENGKEESKIENISSFIVRRDK